MDRSCYVCGEIFTQWTRWEICQECLKKLGIIDEEVDNA